MEKIIKIEIPEGYDDVVFDNETNSIKYIKKDNKPRSWEEFCKNHPQYYGECFIDENSSYEPVLYPSTRDAESDKNLCTSKEEAEAFLALMQLRQLRKAWVGDWKPNWCAETEILKYTICCRNDVITIVKFCSTAKSMSFPTQKMAEEFLECFKDLLEKAKVLL